jgi:hypothetical protein
VLTQSPLRHLMPHLFGSSFNITLNFCCWDPNILQMISKTHPNSDYINKTCYLTSGNYFSSRTLTQEVLQKCPQAAQSTSEGLGLTTPVVAECRNMWPTQNAQRITDCQPVGGQNCYHKAVGVSIGTKRLQGGRLFYIAHSDVTPPLHETIQTAVCLA